MLNWLVAASKLHKHRVKCCTAEWPFYVFLFYGKDTKELYVRSNETWNVLVDEEKVHNDIHVRIP